MQSLKIFIQYLCSVNAMVMCRLFPDDSTAGTILCIFFTFTRSRGQAADYKLSCWLGPERIPAEYLLAAPSSKDLGYLCGNGIVGCSPQPLLRAKSVIVCHPQLYSVTKPGRLMSYFVKIMPAESSKVWE